MSRILQYAQKCQQVGFAQAVRSVLSRFTQHAFTKSWRTRALHKKANHTWSDIVAKERQEDSFALFFAKLQKRMSAFPRDAFLLNYSDQFILTKAHEAKNNVFDLLGSGPIKLKKIDWHIDFRLQEQDSTADCTFPADVYYKDIQITSGTHATLSKDIKIPWELSRFQHALFFGQAYQQTADESYVAAFTYQVANWIHHNPFLLGVNWVCPMEVALRAINWIWAFSYFKDAPVSLVFWQKFICSLYDHLVYLENNWELYDGRTSNHYLSDLVGYLYLCYFFSDLPSMHTKIYACYERILDEMQRQVFAEGTSYEGSTQYHRLVTELFFHAYCIKKAHGFSVSDWYQERLHAMCSFIDMCSYGDGTLISIGDYDSGSVLYGGLSQSVIQKYKVQSESKSAIIKHYYNFGLSVMKAGDWHITLRHHAYAKKQPSGHFHNDAAGITLAYKSIPILVDPGSFVYTPSSYWRNYFRSVKVHNTFFVENEEPVALDERLFALDLSEKKAYAEDRPPGLLVTEHTLYKRIGLQAHRILEYDILSSGLRVTDWWEQYHTQQCNQIGVWNFAFAPGLTLYKQQNEWIVCNQGNALIALLSDNLEFEVIEGWYSGAYGVKESTVMLRARTPIVYSRRSRIFFKPM